MTLSELGDEIDNARCGADDKLRIAMKLGPVEIEAHIESTAEYRWGYEINLEPFTKEEMEALLAEYEED